MAGRHATRWNLLLGARGGDLEITTYLADQVVVDLSMAWESRDLPCVGVQVDRMVRAFSQDAAAVGLEVTDEIHPFHAVRRNGSRMTSMPAASSRAAARFASRTSATASSRFVRVSSSVAPWVFAPGSSST